MASCVLADGSQYSSAPDGLFRRPSEGQSLISYLSEQDFGSCADLEKVSANSSLRSAFFFLILCMIFITRIHIPSLQENAHFSISESLIAAIELMKCNMRRRAEEAEEEGDSDSEIQQLKQKIRLRRMQIRRTRLKPTLSSNNRKMRCSRPRYTHGKVLFCSSHGFK